MDKFEKAIIGKIDAILHSANWYLENGTNVLPNNVKSDFINQAKILLAGLRKYQAMKKELKAIKREIELG